MNPDYFIVSAHPNLPRYPDSEYARLAKRRENYLEEVSLGNAKWSFKPDRIVARPPSFAEDPFGICNLSGEFVISLPEKTITCGKKNKAREWPLDDSWQVTSETFSTRTQLWEEASGNKETLGTAAEVKLFSKKHHMCFIMHVAQKYDCQEVADKVREFLKHKGGTEKNKENTEIAIHSVHCCRQAPASISKLMVSVFTDIFQDHMILQQGVPVKIRGTADMGEKVTVHFASQEASTTAKTAGNWQVELDPLKTSSEHR